MLSRVRALTTREHSVFEVSGKLTCHPNPSQDRIIFLAGDLTFANTILAAPKKIVWIGAWEVGEWPRIPTRRFVSLVECFAGAPPETSPPYGC